MNLLAGIRTWRPKVGWLEIGFLVLIVASLVMRLWELDGRTMHYDEAIHLHYAWRLANLDEYIHSPWMHGPFQIEFVALMIRLLGDTDFIARLGYALFGTALVALPYFLRQHLGRTGSLLAGVMLAVSPAMLYFSRFGRNDIIMAFWATALLVLLWRYIHEEKDRYLYLASAVLAFMFATKETAYFIALIFGALAFLLALPQLAPVIFRRRSLRRIAGPAAFFLLIFTLTLPQWSAVSGLFQDFLGLTITNPDGVAGGIVGAPQWDGQLIVLPVYNAPIWLHSIVAALAIGALILLSFKGRSSVKFLACRVGVPLITIAAASLALLTPNALPAWVSLVIAGILLLIGVGVLVALRHPWKAGLGLVLGSSAITALYLSLFAQVINVGAIVHGILPSGVAVDTSVNGIPLNFVVAGAILVATFLIGAFFGTFWRGGVWLVCAAIFYLIWLTLYTTLFTNWAGAFTGVWQGMGYWIAQQEVARGNQPWYYYFVGISVYELLPVIFGIVGAFYFLRKGDALGLVLAIWAGLTLLAYTLASEKMPWLLVNITLPFILLSGKYLGELAAMVRWREALTKGTVLLLLLPSAVIIGCVFVVRSSLQLEAPLTEMHWLTAVGIAAVSLLSAFLIRLSQASTGTALAGLGVAVLLLGFGSWTAFRAAYTYDDSDREILVYAQGSADIPQTYTELEQQALDTSTETEVAYVDYDMWYPFQWYARQDTDRGTMKFSCFKKEGEDGWTPGCNSLTESSGSDASALLVTASHINNDSSLLDTYSKTGPMRNLLWFPESYRRPGENRQEEPPMEELSKDLQFFWESASSRQTVGRTLDYILFRNLEREWYKSEYYEYIK